MPVALALATFAFVVPFTESGVCITLLLTRLPYGGGWLYAADLAGAALGCLGVIFVLLAVDPVSATLWIGALAAGAGWIVVRSNGDVRTLRLSCAVALTLATAAAVHTGLDVSGKSHLGVFWAKGTEQKGTLFERWNTYSRVRVTPYGNSTPFGWGLARAGDEIEQNYLDIDADASTVITRFDGDLSKLAYLKDDVINAAYLVQPPADVAVVGVGGGRDILSGLYFGATAGGPARRLVGLELDWSGIEGMYAKHGLAPAISPFVHRAPVPVYKEGKQVGRATSINVGTTIKEMVGFGSVDRVHSRAERASASSGASKASGERSARPWCLCRSSTSTASAPSSGRSGNTVAGPLRTAALGT